MKIVLIGYFLIKIDFKHSYHANNKGFFHQTTFLYSVFSKLFFFSVKKSEDKSMLKGSIADLVNVPLCG